MRLFRSLVSATALVGLCISQIISAPVLAATASVDDYDGLGNQIPSKIQGDTITASEFNSVVDVLKGIITDDNGTPTLGSDDFYGLGVNPVVGKKLNIGGDLEIAGIVCDANGCIGDSSWIPSVGVGISYGTDSRTVGVGTNTPKGKFHVDRQNGEGPLVISKGFHGWSPDNSYDLAIGDGSSYWGMSGGDTFFLGRAGSNHFFIGNTGNVGVGSTSPNGKLTVRGTGGANSGLRIENSNESGTLAFDSNAADAPLAISYTGSGNNEIEVQHDGDVIINPSAGNLGIGDTTPDHKLTVEGNIRVATGYDVCVENGRCLSQISGSGVTQHEGWPDAIQCQITSPNWGVAAFYMTYAPVTEFSSLNNKHVYRLHHADRISVVFNSDKTFYGYQNIYNTTCDNKNTQQLYDEGKAFNFLSMPVCGDQQTLKFRDSTNSWECADTSDTLPSCAHGETLSYDNGNAEWVCAAANALPICSGSQVVTFNDTSSAWECSDLIDVAFPNCTADQGLRFDDSAGAWACVDLAAGLPTTCADGEVVKYDQATTTWVCDSATSAAHYSLAFGGNLSLGTDGYYLNANNDGSKSSQPSSNDATENNIPKTGLIDAFSWQCDCTSGPEFEVRINGTVAETVTLTGSAGTVPLSILVSENDVVQVRHKDGTALSNETTTTLLGTFGASPEGGALPTCTDGQVLEYNLAAGQWECSDAGTGGGGGGSLPTCTDGQILTYEDSSSSWICANNTGGGGGSGSTSIESNWPDVIACPRSDGADSYFYFAGNSSGSNKYYGIPGTDWNISFDGTTRAFAVLNGTSASTYINNTIAGTDCANAGTTVDDVTSLNLVGGGSASLPTCTDGQILAYEDSSSSWICNNGSGGGGGSLPTCADTEILSYNGATSGWECTDNTPDDADIISLYKSTNQTLSGVYEAIDFNQQVRIDGTYSHSTSSDPSEITINEDGWYELSTHITTSATAGTARSASTAKVEIDFGSGWADIPGTTVHMYNREVFEGAATAGASIWHNFSAGDKIRIVARRESGSNTIEVVANSTAVNLEKEQAASAGGGGAALPTCGNGQIIEYSTGSGAWVCGTDDTGGGGSSLPTCTDGQIIKYNTTTTNWECGDETGGSGSLPTCTNGQIATYNTSTSLWECADNTGGSSQWDTATGGINYASGNVGINTPNPFVKLDVLTDAANEGAIRALLGDNWQALVPELGTTAYNDISSAGDQGIIFTNDSSNLGTATNGFVIAPHASSASGLKIMEDGNIGIGTATPYTPAAGYNALTINAATGGQLALNSNNTNKLLLYTSTSAQHLGFADTLSIDEIGAGTRITIDGSGNVGIGDPTPDNTLKLDVAGQIGATEYCNEDGSVCTAAANLGGGTTPFAENNDLSDITVYSDSTSGGFSTRTLVNITSGGGYLTGGMVTGPRFQSVDNVYGHVTITVDGVQSRFPSSSTSFAAEDTRGDDFHVLSLPMIKFDNSLLIQYEKTGDTNDYLIGHAYIKQ